MASPLIELWSFLRIHKKLWLAPILIIFLLFGGLLFLTKGSTSGAVCLCLVLAGYLAKLALHRLRKE